MKNKVAGVLLVVCIYSLSIYLGGCGEAVKEEVSVGAAPTVITVSPTNGATGAVVSTVISATFSKAMDASTMVASNFTVSSTLGAVTGTVSYDAGSKTLTLTPASNLNYSTTYTATISAGVKDISGNTMTANYTWSFTTKPSPGTLDSGFDIGGKVMTAIGSGNDYARAVAIQSDGKIVAAGYYYGANNDFAVVRYNTDGTPDTTFGTGGKVTTDIGGSGDYAYAVAIQSDGKIVVAGTSSNGTNNDFAVVRYNTDGTLDTTFDTDGKVTTAIGGSYDSANAIAIQSDGKIVAAGTSFNGADDDFALVRYNTNGTLDTTFDTDGKVTTAIGGSYDYANAIAIQSDGKIVVAGSYYNGADDDFALVRYNTDGTLDTTFDTDGKVTTAIGSGSDSANAIAIQSEGKIVAAGYYFNGTDFDFAVVRYNIDGTLDTTFDTDGKVTTAIGSGTDVARAIAIQSDGKIVAAGSYYNGADNDFALVRYNTDGTLDTTFDTDGKVTTAIGSGSDSANAIAIQSDGKIVAAGYYYNGTDNDFALTRYWP